MNWFSKLFKEKPKHWVYTLYCPCGDVYYVALPKSEYPDYQASVFVRAKHPRCAPCSFPKIGQELRVVLINFDREVVGVAVNGGDKPDLYLSYLPEVP